MATATREYTDASMDVAGARQYFADKMAFTTGPVELMRAVSNGEVCVIDLRDAGSFGKGHVPGAHNLPQDAWQSQDVLTKDRPNVLYCYHEDCHLAAKAALVFATQGYPVMELDGGWERFETMDLEIERWG